MRRRCCLRCTPLHFFALGRADLPGACLGAYTTGFVPNAIKFHPSADKQHLFVAGMQNKKIVQFDMNSGEVVQEYNEHLGPINTITFYDEGRRFLTTSDDKAIRCASMIIREHG